MRLLRRLLLALTVLLLIAGAGGVFFWVKIARQVNATLDERQTDLTHLRKKVYPRDVHAPPTVKGKFSELAQPSVDWLDHHAKEITAAGQACGDAAHPGQRLTADMKRLAAPLPPGCEAYAQAGWEGVGGLLHATHAENGFTPALLDPGPGGPDAPWMLDVPWIATVRMITLMNAFRPDDALTVCADLLALTRDFANGSGLVGLGIESSDIDLVFATCSVARNRAGPTAQDVFRAAVERILKSLPPLSDTFTVEGMAETLANVPTLSSPFELLPFLEARDELLRRDRTFVGLAAAADLAPDERQTVFKTLLNQERQSWNPLAAMATPDWESWAERDDAARAELHALATSISEPGGEPLRAAPKTP